MSAGQEDLWPTGFAADGQDQAAHAVTGLQHFARDLLIAADHPFSFTQIDHHVAELGALDDAGDDLALAVLEFFILALTLGIAHLLHDHLLGTLRGNAAEFDWRQRIDDKTAQFGGLVLLQRILQADLLEEIFRLFHHFQHAPQAGFTGLGIDLGADVVFGTIAGTGGALNGVFHRLDHDGAID